MTSFSKQDQDTANALAAHGINTEFMLSPNSNKRPDGCLPDCLVLHYTCLNMKRSIAHLSCQEKGVSTHYIIDRDGSLVQLVPLARRSWHAGVSTLYGRNDVNSFSIGIDLIYIPGEHHDYTRHQYEVLAHLTRELVARFDIPSHRIVGHEHVALPPGRKQDPGSDFDWLRLFRALGVEEPPAIVLNAR